MRLLRTLVTFVDGTEDKQASQVIAATSKYTSGLKTFIDALAGGSSVLAALARGIGISSDSVSQQYRNEGIDPTRVEANMREQMAALGVPSTADEANTMLAESEEGARAGVIPTWALVGVGLLAVMFLGVGGRSRLGRGRGRGRGFVARVRYRVGRSFRSKRRRR